MGKQRAYTLGARGEAMAATRERILRSVLDLSEEKMTIEITLGEVASRAGTSVQTVLRHFGTREGLLDAAVAKASAEVAEERRAPAGDPEAAIGVIVAHYERRGDFVLRLLSQEHDPRIGAVVGPGKLLHRAWVEEMFQRQLDARPGADRDALVDLLVVATDVYAWKLLRRDRGLDPDTTRARMFALVSAILAAG
ncbi:TetR/AcrR family transcriptional regulator [Phytohabitans flavus]|uniref:TetR/AcrR family transcriptional regulator n=1 Tax=Phytohabitans flavus TaxID=1076124 RepID=UPI0036401ABE